MDTSWVDHHECSAQAIHRVFKYSTYISFSAYDNPVPKSCLGCCAFFVWAVRDFAAARRREPLAGAKARSGTAARDVLVVIIGAAAWALFAAYLHGWLIGVRLFG
ncbi:MAG TPA: NnrU family protein [Azonexus sp.]|nr:NnrU family protein [Azonexus sp.]